jgi:putative sterol carrier protein
MPTYQEISQGMVESFLPDKAEGVNAIIQFDLTGDNGGQFYLEIKDGAVEAHDGTSEDAKMTLTASLEDYYAVTMGQMNPMNAFMQGKLKVKGDMGLAMKMQTMFKREE